MLVASGCVSGYYPGGPLASLDLYTYESTPDYPQTVTLVDTVSGETLWSVDVPVGKQLVVRFREGEAKGDNSLPDLMRWEIMKIGTRSGVLDNAMPVPPPWRRRLDTYVRRSLDAPERPATTAGGDAKSP